MQPGNIKIPEIIIDKRCFRRRENILKEFVTRFDGKRENSQLIVIKNPPRVFRSRHSDEDDGEEDAHLSAQASVSDGVFCLEKRRS